VLGVLIFAAGGVGDLIWHEIFGVEKDFEALLSPSHLVLGLGIGLIVSGPLRAAWQRPGREVGWRQLAPALLSTMLLISAFTFFMMFSHPLMSNAGGAQHYQFFNEIGQMAGATGMMLMSGILVGPVLLLMRRWQLPLGSLAVMWGINSIAVSLIRWHHSFTIYLLIAMMTAAVAADLLAAGLRPGPDRPSALHLFGFVAPVLLFGAFFVAQGLSEGTRWSVHLWAGTVVLAGVVGWLLSYLVQPPAIPDAAESSSRQDF
jgi:hypothetical protein